MLLRIILRLFVRTTKIFQATEMGEQVSFEKTPRLLDLCFQNSSFNEDSLKEKSVEFKNH